MLRVGRADAVGGHLDRITPLVGIGHRGADAAVGIEAGYHQGVSSGGAQHRVEPARFEAAEKALVHDFLAAVFGQHCRWHDARRAAEALPDTLSLPMRHAVRAILPYERADMDDGQSHLAKAVEQGPDGRQQAVGRRREAGAGQKIVLHIDENQGRLHPPRSEQTCCGRGDALADFRGADNARRGARDVGGAPSLSQHGRNRRFDRRRLMVPAEALAQ